MSTADYKAMRAAAKLPEREVPTCLRGDLVREFEAIERELEELPKTDSLESGAGALLERQEAIKAEMRENTYLVRLRAMPGPKWRKFAAGHPARRDDNGDIYPEDRGLLLNTASMWEPLIRASVIDPALPTDEDWDEFNDGLTENQYSELGVAALALNRGAISIPFSRAELRMRRSSASE